MTGSLSFVAAAFAVLAVPSNLVAAIVGVLAGVALTAPFRRVGLAGATALVVAMPVASQLDPIAGLILLGAMAAAALTIGAHDFHRTEPMRDWPMPARWRVPVVALLAGLVLVTGSDWAARMVQALTAGDRIMLLTAGAALAAIVATVLGNDGWAASVSLVAVGVICQFGPLQLLDVEHASPYPVLAGLLLIGPAAMALALPEREPRRLPGRGATHLAAKIVPAFLAGLPVTLGAALFALNLGENGLFLGPRLMMQRPKLVLGLSLAMILASVIAAAVAMLTDAMAGRGLLRWRWPVLTGSRVTQLAAGLVLGLALVGLYRTGIDSERMFVTALAAIVGGIAAWRRLDLAPFVIGLVFGQLMQPSLQQAATAKGGLIAAIAAGSSTLIVLAVSAIAVALAWPLINRWRGSVAMAA